MNRSHTVSVGIAADPKSVYDYASDPSNLPDWAPGFVKSIAKHGSEWMAETPLGQAKVRFAPANEFGILDHDVELASGAVHNPMRVVPNGAGSEVLFTLIQLPDTRDEQFQSDMNAVRADLNKLRTVVEHRARGSGGFGVMRHLFIVMLGFGALAAANVHAQGEPPLVKRFEAGNITMLQTRDGRMWSPLVDKIATNAQPSQTRYFNAVKAQSAASGGEILLVTTLYLPPAAATGPRSFEETFEVQCEADKVKRIASVGFSGEYLTGSKATGTAPALAAPEKTWLIAQACAAREFELQYRGADPFG